MKNNLSDRQYFILACFSDNLQEFYKEYIEQKPARIQLFNILSDNIYQHKIWSPSKICTESGEVLTDDNIDIKIGYWTPNIWKPIRKDLLQQAKSFEALECQRIDKSCNDCFYLNRSEKSCTKLNKSVTIISNHCFPENNTCFLHRKDATL